MFCTKNRFFLLPILFFLLILFADLNSTNVNKQSQPPLLSTAKYQALRNSFEAVLNDKKLGKAKCSIAVYSFASNSIVYSKNTNETIVPASNMKLFSTFNAFKTYGKDYQVKTTVYTDAEEIKDGEINGNLYIVGKGDALLSVSDIDFIVEQISNLGITHINGNIYADGSYYDYQQNRMAYSGDRDMVEPMPLVSALSLERNTATVRISSGSKKGSGIKVQIIPESDAFKVAVNANISEPKPVKKEKKASKPKKQSKKKKSKGYGGALVSKKRNKSECRASSVRVSSKLSDDGKQIFYINGSLGPNRVVTYYQHILNPNFAVAGALKVRLINNGIKISGTIGEKELPEGNIPRFLAVVAHPMKSIIKIVNKESDNYLAENIFKMVGASVRNNNSTAVNTRELIAKVLDSIAVQLNITAPSPNIRRYNDGSGLSRNNQVMVNDIINMLVYAYNADFGQSFAETLSIAGVDGTLRKRMKNTLAFNNLIGKTGTLNNVSALSGYVKGKSGDLYAFSFICNGSNAGSFKSMENKLGIILSEM